MGENERANLRAFPASVQFDRTGKKVGGKTTGMNPFLLQTHGNFATIVSAHHEISSGQNTLRTVFWR